MTKSIKRKSRKNGKTRNLTPNQIMKRDRRVFKNRILKTFTDAGFYHIQTNGKEMYIGTRTVEIDALFVYENIWLICEDTIKTTNIREHIQTKNEAITQIRENFSAFVTEVIKKCPERKDILTKYTVDRIKHFAFYIPKHEVSLSSDDYTRYSNLHFIQPKTLNYFQWISQSIKKSARNEVFCFLNLKRNDIGTPSSLRENSEISTTIIYPPYFTGRKDNVRVVSFMMSAEDLLNTCYVLRKDNWNTSIWAYQRLIDKNKIKKIRAYLRDKGGTFYNNVIVGLPEGVRFSDDEGEFKKIDQINRDHIGRYTLHIPKELNSICVIDGQHRIFAHYEGNPCSEETTIGKLRKERHLLVTGLVFPSRMSNIDKARIQSEIFVDINSNAKLVPRNILLQIKRIQNPTADESIAQFVLEKLNEEGAFKGLLQMSSLESGKIKTASIALFALRYLVAIQPTEGQESLCQYWDGSKDDLLAAKQDAIVGYVSFCARVLNMYFSAIKKNFSLQWNFGADSKLLSVIAINGFVIALTRQLKVNGVKDFDFYDKSFKDWQCDFSLKNFPYTSSQYRKFSTKILKEVFNITEA